MIHSVALQTGLFLRDEQTFPEDGGDLDEFEYFESYEWEEKLEQALTEAQTEAIEKWCHSKKDDLQALSGVPDALRQYIPPDLKLAFQAQVDQQLA